MGGINKLTSLAVKRITKRGYYGDGGGLWLQVGKSGTKSWVFRFTLDGRSREMGLGALHTVSLSKAREIARDHRKLLLEGTDPIERRVDAKAARRLSQARSLTFDECASAYIAAHKSAWRNAKHASQWRATLTTYASPILGDLPVADIDTALVMRCLDPIWKEKTETASRVRGRIESVLDWAGARGYRRGENAARWKGHLDKLLPAKAKVRRVKHHRALPYREIGAFMVQLRKQNGIAALALEFTVLTAARTGEVIGARWDEIDRDAATWTIPANRMKSRKAHRVPLCSRAVAILETVKPLNSQWVFPSRRGHLSTGGMTMLLRRMGKPVTVHGFRSTFRDWCAEMTAYPREAAEMALAHIVSDAVEAAYRRGDLFEKRVRLMDEWAAHCNREAAPGEVVSIGARSFADG